MDILSNEHKKIIKHLNLITSHRVYYGGSLEDFLLLGYADKPIGDLDVLIYDEDTLNILLEEHDTKNSVPSYFNNLMSHHHMKNEVFIDGIKIDLLHSPHVDSNMKFTSTIYDGLLIKHRDFSSKVKVLSEWIDKSLPNNEWAYDKFTKILKKYENINNK